MAPRKVVTVNRLMAVIDRPAAAAAATDALRREGFPAGAVTVLLGDHDADRIDSLGKMRGLWARAWRIVQFMQMDQMVDLAVYEAALRDGRAVITVHARHADERERAKRALAAAGAHFMNYFGRIATEEVSRWRGKELPLHPALRR
jgi:cell division inhibitor SulA